MLLIGMGSEEGRTFGKGGFFSHIFYFLCQLVGDDLMMGGFNLILLLASLMLIVR